ncbi:MAG: hypothetical protein CVU14_04150 [Bacteroidetes bacterium HGW-Bacteroidetes-9]|nr:MAG: hypothetical protein CVU14_04150 [Bacteroidetes bacterium HGW-Bacteroidetes-9]
MLNRLRHIFLLTLLVFSALWVAGQAAVPDSVCVGSTKKYWVNGSPGSIYEWRVNGVIQPSVIDTLYVTWSSPWDPSATPYVVTVQEQNLEGCVGELMSSEVVVLESLIASVDLVWTETVCEGNQATLTATLPVNGGDNPVFIWFVNGIEMQNGPSDTYTFTPVNGDQVSVAMASDEACVANSPAISPTISMVVSPLLLVEVSVSANISPICAGTEVTYTASPGNGGPNPVFSWFVNGVLVQNGALDTYAFVPVDGDQLYVSLTSDAVCTINPTVNSDLITIDVFPLAAPQFDLIGPLCQNSVPPLLPGVSLNGISGNWSPAVIGTGIAGNFTYTFTPDGGQCAESVDITVVVDPEITPAFNLSNTLCINSTPPDLPLTSANGLAGSWDPPVVNTAVAGTTAYTFTPDAGQCAVPLVFEITVTEETTPVFTPFALVCQNSVPPVLPDVSLNGISGSWDPPVINSTVAGNFIFTFIPDDGECAVATSVEITVSPEVFPQFDQIGPLCLNSVPPVFSGISLNGITGTWDPAIISTGALGSTTYRFTPDDGQCAIEYRMDIEVSDQILPLFDAIGPICLNSTAPVLPTVSNNGITGIWNPATVSTGTLGTDTYIFTPDPGQCGVETSLEITVSDQILPLFDAIGPLCLNSVPPDLQLTSLNGIDGTWSPASINTGTIGSSVYTFTPVGGQCGIETTLEVSVTDEIVPVFEPIGPLCINATVPVLPTISPEGITGTWFPATVNTAAIGLFIFEFTPDPGQCAVQTSINIEITDGILPVFDPIGPLCQNSTAPALPAVSINGISGSWNPAVIDTSIPGLHTYTFNPDIGGCGLQTTLDILITNEILPVFTQIGPLCLNSVPPDLPLISDNSLSGSWNPAAINTSLVGADLYTFTPDAGQCGLPFVMEITISDEILPVFDPMGPFCFNSIAQPLPATSLNGISGTWVPPAINTLFIGITTYVFTPDPDQCASGATLDIEVSDQIDPEFDLNTTLCLGSAPPDLPAVSINGISGSWNPATINTGSIGTLAYTFSPDAGQCGEIFTIDITVTDQINPEFDLITILCLGSTPPDLPTVSTNGISGSWNPATINTGSIGTLTYTFTPDDGQCGAIFTIDITVTDQINPEFDLNNTLCLGITPPDLPAVSINDISGSWNPATINTGSIGTLTYTFTPDDGQCGAIFTIDITVTDQINPEFDLNTTLCLGSTPPALPTVSNNGISGSWNPAVINNGTAGTLTYTFTPDAGQCGAVFTIDITVTDQIDPEFDLNTTLCLGSTPPALPAVSNNGISGSWNPVAINTGTTGTLTYIFTPDAGQCGAVFTIDVTITDQIDPVFVLNTTFCLGSNAPVLPTVSNNGISGSWNPSVINTGTAGTLMYTFTPNVGQCGSIYTIDITVADQITPEFDPIATLCVGSTPPDLPAISNNGISGTWSPSVINTSANGTTIYTFKPDATNDCAIQTYLSVEVNSPVIINAETIPATNGQPNGSVTIIASGGTEPLEYQVDGMGWQNASLFENLTIATHTAWVRDANGCLTSQEFIITNHVQSDVMISADTSSYCINLPVYVPVDAINFNEIAAFTIEITFNPLLLSYNGLVNENDILLSVGQFSPSPGYGVVSIRYSAINGSATIPAGAQLFELSFTALAPGFSELIWNTVDYVIYTDVGTNIPGIFSEGLAELLPAPKVIANGGGTFCEGDSTMLSVTSTDAQILNYEWNGPAGANGNSDKLILPDLTLSNTGNYEVIATNSNFCEERRQFSVSVNPKPVFSIAETDSLCAGKPYLLDAGGGYESYLWQDGNFSQTYEARDAGQYTVQVVNAYNCAGESSVWLVPCTLEMTIPTAFTPNDDNLNDVFRPVLEGDIKPSRFSMQIYNKWGELIYETSDYEAGWDGKFNGSLAPRGVYVFVVSFDVPGYIATTLKSPVRGSVTLLR